MNDFEDEEYVNALMKMDKHYMSAEKDIRVWKRKNLLLE